MRILLAAAAFLATPSLATPPVPPPPTPAAPSPKLLLVISVDQLSSDLFEAYRQHFTGGLARMQLGTTFLNGYQSHAATETCPGHATLLTGERPSRNGIVANTWIAQAAAREDKTIYCAEDERAPGSTSRAYTVSAEHLRATTLGERVKALTPASRNMAVAGKDRAAVMMTGRNADQRWFWNGQRFATDRKQTAVPQSVAMLNTALERRLAQPSAPLQPPPLCQAKAKPYALTPQLTVGAGQLARAAGDKNAFKSHPDFDGAVLALSAGLVQEFALGRGSATDILSIGLSATDYVGHAFGTGGSEMCLQLMALDRELGDFFGVLDRTGIDYMVALTADHGAMDIPERLRDAGNSAAQRADAALLTANVSKTIAAQLSLRGTVLRGPGAAGDVWLDAGLSPRDRARVSQATVAYYRAHPQVAAVFTRGELAQAPEPSGHVRNWDLRSRVRASFDPTRSGDLVVVLKEFVAPIPEPAAGYVAGHGTPWDYDRRVPILFWHRGVKAAVSAEAVETIDIMPTLAGILGVPTAASAPTGRCLLQVEGVTCPPR
ncbi:MAG: Alkaline phosphatase; Type I phosphodiesterase/nucleotide pyrophosphatase precursor [uncultured Sphingomonas sp.]|uniref:Alkaline phosphatase n=1 Tax=uncultured Sphingomonas sp. TaxID=158754 RepID=A0A6J4SJ08_9SPHN|nr:MAG: Alkaline phosphatase; Type I phosphodiesterase/nucleotide pyrophosphatase precursor [uncultured Sphingomonas sp.]